MPARYFLTLKEDAAAVALELGNSPQVLLTHYRELVTREQAGGVLGHQARISLMVRLTTPSDGAVVRRTAMVRNATAEASGW
ncbi:MAG: hypothetical protein H7A46_22945 [Verrucomicrobiales bacterium]|nr:hypothetical protein [Verrucomicrobiales bacterium]